MQIVLVPTTHWDREWYRTFQAFRSRLVDTVDLVLDLVREDPGYRFLLDGQTIVCEDYVAIRPSRRTELEDAIAAGRIAIGPWYVQPDSLLPSGEAHVRNLLEGRMAGEAFGPVSRVGYTPDSFGHPARFPQIFEGFGIDTFLYWRGNGDEIAELPAEFRWEAPDGTGVLACHLGEGYFNAAGLPHELEAAGAQLGGTVEALEHRTTSGRILLLAGSDHQLPDLRTRELAEALERRTGHDVRRGLLEDFTEGLSRDDRPIFRGEMIGGRVANLLPGVWSTRTYLKLRNRACETRLVGWAEPWAAIGNRLGAPDERPALRAAWRELLQNQAHDSICGCSQDDVHEQMLPRYDAAWELARETTHRACERIAGLGAERRVPWTDELDIAVFNPSPHPRTDVVRFPLDPYPPFTASGEDDHRFHPLLRANVRPRGFEVDGRPARLVPAEHPDRVRIVPEQEDWEVEFVAEDVPAMGWKRVRLCPSDEHPEEVDGGRRISAGTIAVEASDDGTFTITLDGRILRHVGILECVGDRGDTYDHDPVLGRVEQRVDAIQRRRHPSGIEHLTIYRTLEVPSLAPDRSRLDGPTQRIGASVEARVARGMDRVDLRVRVHNGAADHRLRLLVPTGASCSAFTAATTFDSIERTTAPVDDREWRHPAPRTFPHQGWIAANGITVSAPGLSEGEVTPGGVIAVTLLRAVGWLSRPDLRTRPKDAGPPLPTPGAQCVGRTIDARLSLMPTRGPRDPADHELGLLAVPAGADPLHPPGSLLELDPRELVLSAFKPRSGGDGSVLRVLNPTDDDHEAVLRVGFPVAGASAVRLDETDDHGEVDLRDGQLRFLVPARSLRSVHLR